MSLKSLNTLEALKGNSSSFLFCVSEPIIS
jgi:hypothetical protein